MKRRILSLFISLALCLTLCPAPVLAEGGEAVNPAQTVTGGETPENTEPAESTPGGGTTEEKPETKPEEPGNPEMKPEEPEDTETKPETPGETETKPETPENPEIKPEVPENPEVPGDTETKLETPEETETKPEENGEKPETAERELSKFQAMRASAENSSINMNYGGFVFVQGVPIVIKENGGITSIYDEAGNLLSGEGVDVSNCAIYGGWFDGDNEHTADTSITMESGTVKAIFGGSCSGTLKGTTSIVIESGTVEAIYGGGNGSVTDGSTKIVLNGGNIGELYGGGYAGAVMEDTSVEINGGIINTSVFGGGANSAVHSGTNVKVSSGTVGLVYGGGDYGAVTGGTSVTISGCEEITAVYGGGYCASVDNSNVKIDGGIVGSAFGGGESGAVTGRTTVTINGGVINYTVYGGSNEAAAQSTSIELSGGTAKEIYGGGFGGNSSVDNVEVELTGGTCGEVYGGGRNEGSMVKQATITLGVDWGANDRIYAGGNFGAVTNSSQIIIQNYATESEHNHFLYIDAGTATDSTIIVQQSEGGSSGTANTSKFNLTPIDVKNIEVEYGEVTLLGQSGSELQLNSLEVQESGKVRFQDWDTATVQILSGSGGQLLFPARFESGTSNIVNKPVTVGTISTTAPLIIKAEGTGWTDEKLEEFYFFDGAGVDALTSTDCFFSEGYEVIQQDIPGKDGAKGIYLKKKEAEKPVYISKLEFKENPVDYNGTIPLTVGVAKQLATADQLEVIPNAHIQIRGNNNQDVLFATIQVNDTGTKATITGVDGISREVEITGGYINFDLPVNANLLNTCEEGLKMIATAPNQYSSTAQLIGPNGETKITVNPASITLQGTIPEPVFQASTDVEWSEDGAFYTASVQWRLSDGTTTDTFQMNRDYQADIILTPKSGHWLNEKTIGNKVTYGGQERDCIFNSNGTVTLKNVSGKRFDGYTVTITASPAEGGTVAGANTYLSGSEVTVTASPNTGYIFVGWKENSGIVSAAREYKFTAENNRTLTAVFALEEGGIKLEVDELTEVPDGLKSKPEFDTVEEIKEELRTKVTLAMSDSNAQIVYYDVRLQYLENNIWKDVDPDKFPVGGVVAVLSYPSGTNGTDYTFTVQHMISHGERAGDVETLDYTAVSDGLQCRFYSLSPVAVGYKLKEKTPTTPSTPSTSGTLFTDSSSDDDEQEAANPEYDFWQTVREQIKKAKSGDTVKVNARGYDRMPATVMAALKRSDNVTLRIRWSGGEEIVIPSAKALSEPLRIYYPLSYLAKYDFGDLVPEPTPEHLNPATGGDIEVEAPVTAEAPLDAAGAPVVTDPRRGLAETEEQAEQGMEKAIPGVYQPEIPASEAVNPAEPITPEPEMGRSGGMLPLVLALLAAAVCGGVWVWKNKRDWFAALRKSK